MSRPIRGFPTTSGSTARSAKVFSTASRSEAGKRFNWSRAPPVRTSLATPACALHILQLEDTTGVDVVLTGGEVGHRFLVGQDLECFYQ